MKERKIPTVYKRKYANGDKVELSDLREVYRIAAKLVAEDGDKYLPLFERLDKEMQAREKQEAIKKKALRVAKQNKLLNKNNI